MCVGFILLADSTAFNVFLDIGGKARPRESSGDQLSGFEVARVSDSFMVVTVFMVREQGVNDVKKKERRKKDDTFIV